MRARLPALFSMLLAACGPTVLEGSGVTLSQERPAGAFRGVAVGDGLAATVALGETSVTVQGDDNIVGQLQVEVEGGVLRIYLLEGYVAQPKLPLSARIATPDLVQVTAGGGSWVTATTTPGAAGLVLDATAGSTVVVTGIDAAAVKVTATGSSAVVASGATASLDAVVAGRSRLDASGLACRDASFSVTGASTASLVATQSASGFADAGSKATVAGNPSTRAVTTSGDGLVVYP